MMMTLPAKVFLSFAFLTVSTLRWPSILFLLSCWLEMADGLIKDEAKILFRFLQKKLQSKDCRRATSAVDEQWEMMFKIDIIDLVVYSTSTSAEHARRAGAKIIASTSHGCFSSSRQNETHLNIQTRTHPSLIMVMGHGPQWWPDDSDSHRIKRSHFLRTWPCRTGFTISLRIWIESLYYCWGCSGCSGGVFVKPILMETTVFLKPFRKSFKFQLILQLPMKKKRVG